MPSTVSPHSRELLDIFLCHLVINIFVYLDYISSDTTFVCEGEQLTIECGSNMTIEIHQAVYGRVHGKDFCPHAQIKVHTHTHAHTHSHPYTRMYIHSKTMGRGVISP